MSNKVSTSVEKKEKPHDGFKAVIQFDSAGTELSIKADSTETEVKKLGKNPKKFSFGKVIARNKNSIEAYMYPDSSLDYVFLSFKKDFFAKSTVFILDNRRIKEFICLLMKIRYFLLLSKERRLAYLGKKGYSANINIIKGYGDGSVDR